MTGTEITETDALRAEVELLKGEVALLRAAGWRPAPSCTCGGTAAVGVTGCPVHSWPQVIYPGTAQPWYFPANVCAGAAGYPCTVIVNTAACAEPVKITAMNPAAGACAGGWPSQVYTVTIPA